MQTPTPITLTLALGALIAACSDDVPPMQEESSSGSETESSTTGSTSASVDSTTTSGIDTTASDPDSSTGPAPSDSSDTTAMSTESSTGDEPTMGGYGDCANDDAACLPEEACLFDGFRGVCASQGCETVADCPIPDLAGPMPPSATPAEVVCQDVSGRGQAECFFDCTEGLTAGCPEGMTCVGLGDAALCMWPTFPPGGGQCPDLDLGSRYPQTIMGDNTGAGDDHFPLCSFASGDDYLVQWTAPEDGTFVFNTFGSSALPGGFDTTLAVLDGCPGPGTTEIGCGNNQSGTDSQVTLDLVAGQTVILVVDSQFGDTGPFVLNVQ